MKALLLFVTLLAAFVFNAAAQCNPAVPSNAVVVNSTQTINGGFDPIWVCSGDTLHSDGGFHNIFLESGSVMTTSGGIDTIYVKEGASFFMNGGIHVIFYVTFSDLNLNGGIPEEFSCSSLTYDYTNAPPNGCSIVVIAGFEYSDSILCEGTCINYSNLSENATSWQWSFPGANPSSSSDENPANICHNNSGTYDVTLIASNGNGSDTLSFSNFITVNSQPATPVLSQNGDTLFSSQGYPAYQWYFENTLIPGATNYFYAATENGGYSVVVTDSKGCTASEVIQFVSTGVDQIESVIRIFPNPATTSISIYDSRQETLHFVDLIGREIFFIKTSPSGKTEIDISSFPSIFFVKTESGSLKKVVRY